MADQITSATATAKTVRIAARKARLVIDLIRGRDVAEALAILEFTPRSGSPIIEKVLKSAIANAEHNYDLDAQNPLCKQGLRQRRPDPQAVPSSCQGERITNQQTDKPRYRGCIRKRSIRRITRGSKD